jgi:hypothetical protein
MQVNIALQSKVNIDSTFFHTAVFIIDYNNDDSCSNLFVILHYYWSRLKPPVTLINIVLYLIYTYVLFDM